MATHRTPKAAGGSALRPIHETTTNANSATSAPVIARVAGAPFVLSGARFTVFANDHQGWATFTKTLSPGSGRRWELVTVQVLNRSRTDFDPRVLHYRLIAGRVNHFANPKYGTAPDAGRPPRPLKLGATTFVELAFSVPTAASGLELAFDPAGIPERLIVSLPG